MAGLSQDKLDGGKRIAGVSLQHGEECAGRFFEIHVILCYRCRIGLPNS